MAEQVFLNEAFKYKQRLYLKSNWRFIDFYFNFSPKVSEICH